MLIIVTIVGVIFGIIWFTKKKKEEGYTWLFITAGVNLIITAFGSFHRKLNEIIIILKNSNSVEDSLLVSKHFSEVNVLQIVVGGILISIGIFFLHYLRHRLYILNINGYFENRIEDHYKQLKLSQFEFKEREIDFVNENRHQMDREKTKEILELIQRKVKSFKDESRGNKKGYTGIAHIPFIVMAGTYLKRTDFDTYFEYDKKYTETYYKLDKKKRFPQLLQSDFNNVNKKVKEVVVTVETTTSITSAQLAQFTDCEIIRLFVKNPIDNTIRSRKQLINYKNKVIDVIEKVPKNFPYAEQIHLVCATQSCLLLEIGKSIEDYRNIQVISYHFDIGENKKYPWGIVVNGENKGEYIKG